MSESRTKTAKLSDLVPDDKNANRGTERGSSALEHSLRNFGAGRSILVDKNDRIIAGNKTAEAAGSIGMMKAVIVETKGDQVVVVKRTDIDLDSAEGRGLAVADNRVGELNLEWHQDVLAELNGELDLTPYFFEDELDFPVLDEPVEGLTDDDDVPELGESPVSERGDIWILGNHRVMCGDSTDAADLALLMDGNKADMVYTDPPYGIGESGDRRGRHGDGKNAKWAHFKYKDFNDSTIDYAVQAFKVCEDLNIKRHVWWGANHYCHHLEQTGNWFVWDKRVEDKQKDLNSDCELAWVKSEFNSVRIFRHLWKGLMKGSESRAARVHPTQKPIALAVWCFGYFEGVKSVLDLFLGSGSTLIAAEKTSRKCYGMEILPTYVDVIIKRWEDFTGKEARHEDGRTFQEVSDARNI